MRKMMAMLLVVGVAGIGMPGQLWADGEVVAPTETERTDAPAMSVEEMELGEQALRAQVANMTMVQAAIQEMGDKSEAPISTVAPDVDAETEVPEVDLTQEQNSDSTEASEAKSDDEPIRLGPVMRAIVRVKLRPILGPAQDALATAVDGLTQFTQWARDGINQLIDDAYEYMNPPPD